MNAVEATAARPGIVRSARPITPGKVIIWGGLGVLLYVARVAFIPVALALLFSLVLSAPVEALHKRRVPRSLSALLIFALAFSVIVCAGIRIWTPAQAWLASAPQTIQVIKQRVRPVANFFDHFDQLRKIAAIPNAAGHAAAPAPVEAVPAGESAPSLIVEVTGSAIAALLTFIVVTIFLLTGGPPMMARMTAAFADNLHASHVLNVIDKVRAAVGHFYLTTTFINIGLGTVTGLAMWALGMPTPYLWGALAAVLNYIPYLGSIATLLVVSFVAVVSFNSLGHIFAVAGTYVLIATIEGQIAQPLLVGRRMEVNPLLIFLGLWFAGLYWGIAGIVLATPTLIVLKVIAENSKSGKPMLEFLGPNEQTPERDDRDERVRKLARRVQPNLYQRKQQQ
jgi:predicted PurR-regulated permease PerM